MSQSPSKARNADKQPALEKVYCLRESINFRKLEQMQSYVSCVTSAGDEVSKCMSFVFQSSFTVFDLVPVVPMYDATDYFMGSRKNPAEFQLSKFDDGDTHWFVLRRNP